MLGEAAQEGNDYGWPYVYADGQLHDYEASLLRRITDHAPPSSSSSAADASTTIGASASTNTLSATGARPIPLLFAEASEVLRALVSLTADQLRPARSG